MLMLMFVSDKVTVSQTYLDMTFANAIYPSMRSLRTVPPCILPLLYEDSEVRSLTPADVVLEREGRAGRHGLSRQQARVGRIADLLGDSSGHEQGGRHADEDDQEHPQQCIACGENLA